MKRRGIEVVDGGACLNYGYSWKGSIETDRNSIYDSCQEFKGKKRTYNDFFHLYKSISFGDTVIYTILKCIYWLKWKPKVRPLTILQARMSQASSWNLFSYDTKVPNLVQYVFPSTTHRANESQLQTNSTPTYWYHVPSPIIMNKSNASYRHDNTYTISRNEIIKSNRIWPPQ